MMHTNRQANLPGKQQRFGTRVRCHRRIYPTWCYRETQSHKSKDQNLSGPMSQVDSLKDVQHRIYLNWQLR